MTLELGFLASDKTTHVFVPTRPRACVLGPETQLDCYIPTEDLGVREI